MGGSVNSLNPKVDQTVRIFDEFYSYQDFVNAEEYDVVNSYMRSVFTSAEAAGNFTVSVFRIANQTNTPVLTILNQLQGLNQIQLTQTLAYYLNNLRSKSTLLGIGASVTPNFYTARNVLP